MKLLKTTLLLCTILVATSCKTETKKEKDIAIKASKAIIESPAELKITPISHATMILQTEDKTIYVDPTGGLEAFKAQAKPNLILITDIHGDHLSLETLEAIDLTGATLIAPKAVVEKLPTTIKAKVVTLHNNDTYDFEGIAIKAIPMYNLREEALKYHSKGRGNGYLLTINEERIYISGDTEDIPEMRALKNIDKAFVCMNLPYTMPVESAANAVIDFIPKTVYPYHYRGTEGLSDIEKFKSIVNEKAPSVTVVFLDWY